MKITTPILALLLMLAPTTVLASDAEKLNSAFNELCDKMELCAIEQMKNEGDLTPQMRSMIEGMIDGMCKNMLDVGEVNQYAELVDPAVACIDSMTSKSCSDLQGDDLQTPECREYEELAKEFSEDIE